MAISFCWEILQETRHIAFTPAMSVRKLYPIWSPPEKFFRNSGSRKAYLPLRNLYVFFFYQQREYRWMWLIVFPFPFSLWLPRSSEPNFWLNINNFVGPCGLHICILSFLLVLTFYPAVCFLCSWIFYYLYFSILLLVFL